MREGGRRAAVVGYVEVVTAAILWGSSGIFSVHLFRWGMTPESVALLRPALGLGLLVALLAVRAPARLRVPRRGLVVLIGIGGLLTGAFQLAYQVATDTVGVPSTVALVYIAPAVVVAASGPVLGEWPSATRAGLALLSVTGVWLTVLGARGVRIDVDPAGVSWGALAGVSYAGYTLFGRYATPRFGSAATVVWSTGGACLLLALFLPILRGTPELPPHGRAWALLVIFAVLTIAVATFLFYDGLGRIEAGRASIATTLEPVVAALLATALLGQGLTARGWVGLGLVTLGVAGAYATRSRPGPRRPGVAPPGG